MSSRVEAPPNVAARIAGWAGLLVFWGAGTATDGYFIGFFPPFQRVDPGAAALWLNSALILAPTAVFFAVGYQQWLGAVLDRLRARVAALTDRERRLSALALGLFALALARVCNEVVLEGYPVTDDEWAVRFGGEVLALGKVMVPLPMDARAIPPRFLFFRDGMVTSIDFLGAQLAWAISALTRSGNWIFALSAAIPVPCLAFVIARRLSASWAVAVAAIFIASPMGFALSLSTHAHLHSRAMLALALAFWVWARPQKKLLPWVLVGLALGGAAISRPAESLMLSLPLLLAETWRALRSRTLLPVVMTVVGALVPIAVFFAYTRAVTGGWMFARYSEGAMVVPTFEPSYWVRFGSNCAFNLLRIGVWFAGPIGIALCFAGAMTSRMTRLLGLGVLCALGIGLFHDNYGVDVVGPIHYSECVVPLAVLAVYGLRRITHAVRALRIDERLPSLITACWLVVGLGSFNIVHSVALEGAADTQSEIYAALERSIPAEARPAVVFAPRFAFVTAASERYHRRGGWVFEWRRPQPDFSDEVMILRDGPGVDSAKAAFPERHFFTLRPVQTEPFFELISDPR